MDMSFNTQQEIQEKVQQLAKIYVPDWRYDEENPDLGMALSQIYCNMQFDTMQKFRDLPLKWKTAFFRYLHTSFRTETPAAGYVYFDLVSDDVRGTPIKEGSRLRTTKTDKNGNEIPVEIQDDVFVLPAKLKGVYESFDKRDYMSCLWRDGDKDGYTLFGLEGKNIQSHLFAFSHFDLFSIEKRGELEVSFLDRDGNPLEERFLQSLGSEGQFCYSTSHGFIPFEKHYRKGNQFVFVKGENQSPWEEDQLEGISQRWLLCEVKNGNHFSDLVLGDIRLKASGTMLLAQRVYAAGIDSNPREYYFPFGEQLSLYEEVYFCSDEALRKKGAWVTLSFLLDFAKIPLYTTESSEMDWKLIMPQSSIKVAKEYDISVAKVIWEYYNGIGWARLPVEKACEGIFDVTEGTHRQKKDLRFFCPYDMDVAMVNAEEARCIRARVLRLNNGLKTQGQYITPILSETYFSYTYPGDGVSPQLLYTNNHCVTQIQRAKEIFSSLYGLRPFTMAEDDKHTIYFCFTKPLEEGPVRFLAVLGDMEEGRKPPLRWQYYKGSVWQDICVEDETDHLRHSGLISMNGMPDSEQKVLFGESGYWMRLIDETGEYERTEKKYLPVVKKIYMNGTRAITLHTKVTEYFTLENFSVLPKFQILYQPIYKAEVWVNETGKLSKGEERTLWAENRLYYDNSQNEEPKVWVKWQEAADFQEQAEDGRKYVLNQEEGTLLFSAGTNYKLPSPGVANGIFVSLSVGGGKDSNLGAYEITGTEETIGFIHQAGNPIAFAGGCDRQTAEEAMERMSEQRKHRFRGVMAEDFENLAKEASPLVYRSFCFTGKKGDGTDQPGFITLVILQEAYENSHYYFQSLKETIKNYLKDKVFLNLIAQDRLHIVSPTFIEIQVSADVIVEGFHHIFQCQKNIEESLQEFLNPISGNFTKKGFSVGVLPARNQIEMVLMNIPEVKEVRNFMITGCITQGTGKIDVDGEKLWEYPFALPVNGKHHIVVYGK